MSIRDESWRTELPWRRRSRSKELFDQFTVHLRESVLHGYWSQFTLRKLLWHIAVWCVVLAYSSTADEASWEKWIIVRFFVLAAIMEFLTHVCGTFRRLLLVTAAIHLALIAQAAVVEALFHFECAMYLMTTLCVLYLEMDVLGMLGWPVLVWALTRKWQRSNTSLTR